MRASWIQASIIGLLSVGSADVAYAQAAEFGQSEYVKSCASCHGRTGKGDGPVAKSLKTAPTDLTKLSETNNGVFPVARVYDIIDGRANVMSHGPRDMPVWGDIFTRQLRYPGSTLSREAIGAMVRANILSLVAYISTLQGK
jgi:mono/diheme cytochrome c family protein